MPSSSRRRLLVLGGSCLLAGCGSALDGATDPAADRSPTAEPTASPTDGPSDSPTDTPPGTPSPDGPCEVGEPTVTGHELVTLQRGSTGDWTERTGIALPTVALDTGADSPGIVVYGSITGADSCAYPGFEGTSYDADAGRLTVRVGIDRRGEACDAAVTTRIYRLWLSLDDATVPRRLRLRQADYDGTRTTEFGTFDC